MTSQIMRSNELDYKIEVLVDDTKTAKAELPFKISPKPMHNLSRNPVYKAEDSDGTKLVVKKFLHDCINYKQEALLLKGLGDHSGIIKARHFISSAKFEGAKCSMIATELAENGDLFDFIMDSEKSLGTKLTVSVFYKILIAIDYMHKKGFAHLDIKPDNILMDRNFNPKINDFDLSQSLEDKKLIGRGTTDYRGPELLDDTCKDFKAADIYSLGCILFILMNKRPIYVEDHKTVNYRLFRNHKSSYWTGYAKKYSSHPAGVTKDFIRLVDKMLSHAPSDRPTIEEVKNDPYIQENLLNDEQYLEEMKKFSGK